MRRVVSSWDITHPQTVGIVALRRTPHDVDRVLDTYSGTIVLRDPIHQGDQGSVGQGDGCSRDELLVELPVPNGPGTGQAWTNGERKDLPQGKTWVLFTPEGSGLKRGGAVHAAVVGVSLGGGPTSWSVDDTWVEFTPNADTSGAAAQQGKSSALSPGKLYLHILVACCGSGTEISRIAYEAVVDGILFGK